MRITTDIEIGRNTVRQWILAKIALWPYLVECVVVRETYEPQGGSHE